jgi:FdhD protein
LVSTPDRRDTPGDNGPDDIVATRGVGVTRVRDAVWTSGVDRAATEEPLEIRLHDRPFAVVMRTPGADRELAAGFLLSERVLRTPDDLGAIAHCTDPDAEHPENIVNVRLVDQAVSELDRIFSGRRNVVTSASCGMCGRLTIESLRVDGPTIHCDWTIPSSSILGIPDRLREAQTVFHQTGGLHAAGLFTREGTLDAFAEDVGRHNAVDKVVGRMLMQDRLPLGNHLLFVSGRTSFEIIQKAFLAGIPLVAAVSAPSSLAVELAEECGVTLIGFVRGAGFNIYTCPGRIVT